MLSVTNRIKTVSQPQNGYVPKTLFSFEKYEDYKELKPIKSALTSIQGLAVDYLSRFILSGDKMKSFDISLLGAAKVDEAYESDKATKNVLSLLEHVTGLNRESVINVCKIVCYDAAYRAGLKHYQSPDETSFENNLFDNVLILTERTLTLLKDIGTIINDGFTFEGGYTELVDSGDGDYLTVDTLIDLKTSKDDFSTKWSLQLLMYYILGIHSVHSEFSSITKLCIVNPYLNQYCVCNIADISDKSKYEVSNNVLGYKMTYRAVSYDKNFNAVYDYSKWQDVDGSDKWVIKQFLTEQSKTTDFNVDNFDNGIFDITVDDYYTFLKSQNEFMMRPLFRNTKSVKFIKYDKYFMFVSVSPKGKYSLLHGARLHSLEYSLEYYYDRLQRYADTVTARFSKYWAALETISKQVSSLYVDEHVLRAEYSEYLETCKSFRIPKSQIQSFELWSSLHSHKPDGYIHGCIVDIDYLNHIYLNPYDGTIVPYYAISMDDKDAFENLQSLLSVKRPDLLESSLQLIDDKSGSSTALMINNEISTALVSKNDIINKKSVKEYSRDMYTISNRIKPLKDIPDMGWVQVWYDDILGENKLLLEDKYKIKKTLSKQKSNDYLHREYVQKGNMTATIISYRNYNDVDVRFEDGYIMNNVSMNRIKRGTIIHPDVEKQIQAKRESKLVMQKSQSDAQRVKNKYIGMTLTMNCGLSATCIDYKNCNDITVKFEDGLIRTGIRSDHFRNGKVAHIDNACGFDKNKECSDGCDYYSSCTRKQ